MPLQEWKALHAFRPNLLIEGPAPDLENTLAALVSDFGGTFVEWPLAPRADPIQCCPAVVVRNVGMLAAHEQHRLFDELDSRLQQRQVIATSSADLFNLVERNVFRADLYYRLSVVRLHVDGWNHS